MDQQNTEVVFLIDPIGTHKCVITERGQPLPLVSREWVYGGLTALISAGNTCLLAVCVDIYFGYPSLKTTTTC